MDFIDLNIPGEPTEAREKTRSLLEASPKKGARAINDAAFIADFLWGEWGEDLESAGVGYDRFLTIARGNAGEARLWIVGERPWGHFADGLAGRVRRRAGVAGTSSGNENELAAATTGVCG